MTGAAMGKEQAAAAVKAAVAERDAIQANLLELDSSFGKQLLAGAELTAAPEEARRVDALRPVSVVLPYALLGPVALLSALLLTRG